MCLLIWTVFSGEPCGQWASCNKQVLGGKCVRTLIKKWCKVKGQSENMHSGCCKVKNRLHRIYYMPLIIWWAQTTKFWHVTFSYIIFFILEDEWDVLNTLFHLFLLLRRKTLFNQWINQPSAFSSGKGDQENVSPLAPFNFCILIFYTNLQVVNRDNISTLS